MAPTGVDLTEDATHPTSSSHACGVRLAPCRAQWSCPCRHARSTLARSSCRRPGPSPLSGCPGSRGTRLRNLRFRGAGGLAEQPTGLAGGKLLRAPIRRMTAPDAAAVGQCSKVRGGGHTVFRDQGHATGSDRYGQGAVSFGADPVQPPKELSDLPASMLPLPASGCSPGDRSMPGFTPRGMTPSSRPGSRTVITPLADEDTDPTFRSRPVLECTPTRVGTLSDAASHPVKLRTRKR